MTEVDFQTVIDELLNEKKPFPARYLYRFSDLGDVEINLLRKTWFNVSLRRRQALMEDLMEMGEQDYLLDFRDVCLVALVDEDPAVRLTAIQTLREYSDRLLMPLLMDLCVTDPNASVRATCASSLGVFVYEGEVDELPKNQQRSIEDQLLSILKGADDELVRRRALESLGYSSREDVLPFIEEAYENGSQDWLVSALIAMGRSCNPDYESRVLAMLKDTRMRVRSEAAYAAGEMTIKRAVPILLSLLKDDEDIVRAAAIWALSETGGAGVEEELQKLLEKTEDDDEAYLIEEALENLAFVEGMDLIPLIDISEPGEDDWIEFDLEEDEFDIDDED
jgi:HEAT repeat protein